MIVHHTKYNNDYHQSIITIVIISHHLTNATFPVGDVLISDELDVTVLLKRLGDGDESSAGATAQTAQQQQREVNIITL